MSHNRVVVLSMLAAFAVSASVSAASAAAMSSGARYFTGGTSLTETKAISGTVGVAQFQLELAGVKILIESTTNELTEAGIEEGGKLKGKLINKNPTIFQIKEGKNEQLSKCTVKEMKIKLAGRLEGGRSSGVVEDFIGPAESGSTLFAEVEIEGAACVLTGGSAKAYKINGDYFASLGDEAEVESTEHEMIFTSLGSELTNESRGMATTLTVSKIKLSTGKHWSVAKSSQPEFSETGITYTMKSGKTIFKTTNNTITCQADKGEGEVKGVSSVVEPKITFEECAGTISGKKCPSTITSDELTGELGNVAGGEAAKEVGVLFKPKAGTALASIECEGSKFTLQGTVAGEVEFASNSTKEGNIIFTPSGTGMKIKKITTVKEEDPKLELNSEEASLESTEAYNLKNKGIDLFICLPVTVNAEYERLRHCMFDIRFGRYSNGWSQFPI